MTRATLGPRERQLREVSEKDWQQQAEDIARLYGWMAYHAPDNRPITGRSGKRYVQNVKAGFPDLVLVHPGLGLLMVVELKTQTGKTTLAQDEWLAAFRAVSPVRVEVLRPGDADRLAAMLDPRRLDGWGR